MIKVLKSSHICLIALFFCSSLCFSCSDSAEEIEKEIEVEVDTVFTLAPGNYRGLWDSNATNGSVYTNLKVTATIEEAEAGKFTGTLYISDDFTACCGGTDGNGPITFNVSDHDVTFEWIDEIPDCNGTFEGSGKLSADNVFRIEMTGNDCEGDHTGNIEFFK